MTVPLSMTDAIVSSPAPNEMPSAAVGMIGHVPSSWLPFMPGVNGVCCFGSHVSVCETPPGSQIKMQASALPTAIVEGAVDGAVDAAVDGAVAATSVPSANCDNPMPAPAASEVLRNSRRFIT